MGKYLGSTGLTYLWGKIKSIFATKTELAGRPTGKIYYGTCSTTANTYVKEATVETFPLDEDDKPLVGTVVAIKYTVTNTYKTEGQTYALNVNNTGAYPMYYNNAAVATSTSANTLVAGYKNRHVFYMFNGTQWVWLTAGYDTNTTYSGMTQAEVDAGTDTTARLITPARLRDNFYTEGEVDTLLGSKANSNDLATVATSGSYNDLDDTPTIPSAVTESTVSGWGFTKNTGTYSKPSDGIPKTDLESSVQTSLGLADTALQSYTETDPTVPAWAKAANKPSYTAAEVGALPDSTVIPAAQVNSDWNASSGVAQILNKPTIPTVPTALSAFTDDLGNNPVHTHSQYLTSHQDVSGKEDKLSIDSTTKTASFTASVGNYYKVSVAASGSITITLTTPADNTKVSSCVFFVSTSTSPTLNFSAASGISIYRSKDFAIEESTYYEVNALWNGTSWYIAQMELEVQS